MAKIVEMESYEAYKKFLGKKDLYVSFPTGAYDGGIAKVYGKLSPGGIYNKEACCHITKHPNCCGAKLLHSASGEQEFLKYAIGTALLWCKVNQNASATYVVADNQTGIEAALLAFKFKEIQNIYNVKSGRHFSTYIINPMEL